MWTYIQVTSCYHTVHAWFQPFGDLASQSSFSPARENEPPVCSVVAEDGVWDIRLLLWEFFFVCSFLTVHNNFIHPHRLYSVFELSKIIWHRYVWYISLCPVCPLLLACDQLEELGQLSRCLFKRISWSDCHAQATGMWSVGHKLAGTCLLRGGPMLFGSIGTLTSLKSFVPNTQT